MIYKLRFTPYLIGILLFIYILIRAIILPITHDESGTCLAFVKMPIIDIVSYKDPIPNNHIINTLLIKLSTQLFGWSNLSVRLPNILGFILYYFSVLAILKKMSKDLLFMLFGIVLMTFNPFLLDFFSLARGYALSISFMVAAILFAIKFQETSDRKNLSVAMLLAAISVYTNFTTLNFYVAFVSLMIALITIKYREVSWNEMVKKIFIVVFISVVLAMFSFVPITKMLATNQFIYWGTNGFYKDTIETLLVSSIYDSNHFGIPVIVLVFPIVTIFCFSFLLLLPTFYQNRNLLFDKPYQFFYLLFIGAIVTNILQFYIAGTPYLSGRTALFFYPLFALSLIGFGKYLIDNKSKIYKPCVILITIFGMVHLIRTYNFNHCFEWWYDANTFEIISLLKKESQKENKTVTLNTNWLFYPSFKFYIETQKLDWLKIAPYHKETQANGEYEYYYATIDDFPLLEQDYVKKLSFDWDTRMLLKKK